MARLFFVVDISITITAVAAPGFNAKHKAKGGFVWCWKCWGFAGKL